MFSLPLNLMVKYVVPDFLIPQKGKAFSTVTAAIQCEATKMDF